MTGVKTVSPQKCPLGSVNSGHDTKWNIFVVVDTSRSRQLTVFTTLFTSSTRWTSSFIGRMFNHLLFRMGRTPLITIRLPPRPNHKFSSGCFIPLHSEKSPIKTLIWNHFSKHDQILWKIAQIILGNTK